MSSITTINSGDLITNSRAVINNNFTALNNDKIETSYLDTDTSLTANSDTKIATQKAVKAYVDSGGQQNASETVRGLVEEATDAEVTAGTATGGTGAKLFVSPAKLATRFGSGLFKFGGTGADGALTITSGATNIDCSNARVVVKNYTSISITGTGSLTFTNPNTNGTIIILKSQGNVTLTSSAAPMIDARYMGAAGGAGTANPNDGNAGSDGKNPFILVDGGNAGAGTSAGTGGTKGTFNNDFDNYSVYLARYMIVAPGSGGGSGKSANGTSGNGGRGGGGLIIECGGAFNFTTTSGIGVDGQVGQAGTGVSWQGGAGGGGGVCLILYNTLTANTGTITVAGGAANATASAYGGGGGASIINNGTNGSGSSSGGGGNGKSIVAANTEFA